MKLTSSTTSNLEVESLSESSILWRAAEILGTALAIGASMACSLWLLNLASLNHHQEQCHREVAHVSSAEPS